MLPRQPGYESLKEVRVITIADQLSSVDFLIHSPLSNMLTSLQSDKVKTCTFHRQKSYQSKVQVCILKSQCNSNVSATLSVDKIPTRISLLRYLALFSYVLFLLSQMINVLQIGNILVLGVGGFLCEWKSFDGGWPSPYYITGGVSVLFCILWWLLIFDSPADHPRISQREKTLINSSNGGSTADVQKKVNYRPY